MNSIRKWYSRIIIYGGNCCASTHEDSLTIQLTLPIKIARVFTTFLFLLLLSFLCDSIILLLNFFFLNLISYNLFLCVSVLCWSVSNHISDERERFRAFIFLSDIDIGLIHTTSCNIFENVISFYVIDFHWVFLDWFLVHTWNKTQ